MVEQSLGLGGEKESGALNGRGEGERADKDGHDRTRAARRTRMADACCENGRWRCHTCMPRQSREEEKERMTSGPERGKERNQV